MMLLGMVLGSGASGTVVQAAPGPTSMSPPERAAVTTSARPLADDVEPPVPQVSGEVVELSTDRASGVVSAWLGNGVLLHVRSVAPPPPPKPAEERPSPAQAERGPGFPFRDSGGNTVVVTICVAGSELLETSANRGISQAAAFAWDRLSVKSMRREDLAAYLDGSKVRIWSMAGPSALTLRIEASPESLEKGLRVARLLLTEPRVRDEDLDAWRSRLATRRNGPRSQGRRLVSETVIDMMFAPADPRPRRPSDESIGSLTTHQVQAWLDDALGVGGAGVGDAGRQDLGGVAKVALTPQPKEQPTPRVPHPIEVAIVGDVPVAEAVRLGSLYLGTLAERPRISPGTFAEVRKAERSEAPLIGTRVIPDWSGNAFVVGGFLGADLKDFADHRALAVAAQIIAARMQEWPIEDRGGGGEGRSGAGAQAIPGSAYPGFGLLIAAAEVPPERADSVMVKMSELLDRFRESGPTPEEVLAARKKLAANAGELNARAGYWSSILSSNVYQGLSLRAVASAEAAYGAISVDDVRGAVKAYDTPERRIRLKITPGLTEAPAPTP